MSQGQHAIGPAPDAAEIIDRLIAPVAVVAPDSTVLYVNPAGLHPLGVDSPHVVGRRWLDLVHPDDRDAVDDELQRVVAGASGGGTTTHRLAAAGHGIWRTFETTIDNLLDNPEISGLLISSRDVTDRVARESALYDVAFKDPLTGLPNRNEINQQLGRIVAAEEPVAVAFIDVDRFAFVRHSLGHTVADTVAGVVAQRVRSAVPDGMLVGQYSGDIVVALLSGPAAADARELLWRVIERVSEPLFVGGHELRLSVSAGIAQGGSTSTTDSLLRDAGLALHQAKVHGGGRVEVFAGSMRDAAVARLEVEANLRRGLTQGEFWLAMQPIVSLPDGLPVAAEALLRWDHDGRFIGPDRFIPVAEETGLIVPIGDWTIDEAARLAEAAPGGRVMVNLSPRQLAAPNLLGRIARALAARQVEPASLGFEVTETLLIENFDYCAQVLCQIRQLGCRVGLDDFGTGYSSLGYLRQLPLDFVKIDGSLTAGIDDDAQAEAIVGAIVSMADALHLDVIAEGIETQGQADTLAALGCRQAQGFLFGRPQRA